MSQSSLGLRVRMMSAVTVNGLSLGAGESAISPVSPCGAKILSSADTDDKFKASFKYYKKRIPPPDLSEVVDFENPLSFDKNGILPHHLDSNMIASECECECEELALEPPSSWKVFTLQQSEGLFFIVNPFRAAGQRYWVKRCIKDYPNPPNITNLKNHQIKFAANNLKELRWVTLGYHHDWDTKIYNLDNQTPFPKDLGQLTATFAKVLGFTNFKAEAAIVNFYHANSTLAGHTDVSEFDLEAPLFSVSFGQPALFMLGGQVKSVKPAVMYVRSGDVIVMSGKSRLAYHAVPRILHSRLGPWCKDNEKQDPRWEEEFQFYLENSRINLNVRQVFCNGDRT